MFQLTKDTSLNQKTAGCQMFRAEIELPAVILMLSCQCRILTLSKTSATVQHFCEISLHSRKPNNIKMLCYCRESAVASVRARVRVESY